MGCSHLLSTTETASASVCIAVNAVQICIVVALIYTMNLENNISILKRLVIPKFYGGVFIGWGEERSELGWIRFYRWVKEDYGNISEAELAKLE